MSVTPTRNASAAREMVRDHEKAKIHPPVRQGGKWVVKCEVDDALDGLQVVEKVFPNESRAMDFYTELFLGYSKTQQFARANAETGVPGLRNDGTTMDQVASGVQSDGRARPKTIRQEGMNLRKVAEVLNQYGLDPTEELVQVLTPVPMVDPDTGLEYRKHTLAPEDRAKILLELLQYAQPKLKAVEMKIEGTLAQMTQEQIDKRLATLIGRAINESKA